jgi:hypothetical protein
MAFPDDCVRPEIAFYGGRTGRLSGLPMSLEIGTANPLRLASITD